MTDTTTNSSNPRDLTIYTTSWCPYCQRLTKLLGERDIPFTNIDVEADAEAAAFVESVNGGDRIVPTVLYSDGSTDTNPGASTVRKKLDELAGQA